MSELRIDWTERPFSHLRRAARYVFAACLLLLPAAFLAFTEHHGTADTIATAFLGVFAGLILFALLSGGVVLGAFLTKGVLDDIASRSVQAGAAGQRTVCCPKSFLAIVALTAVGGSAGLAAASIPFLLIGFSHAILDLAGVVAGCGLGLSVGRQVGNGCNSRVVGTIATLMGLFLLNSAVWLWYSASSPSGVKVSQLSSGSNLGNYEQFRMMMSGGASILFLGLAWRQDWSGRRREGPN